MAARHEMSCWSCLQAGRKRKQGLQHEDIPHISDIAHVSAAELESSNHLLRAAAWWDGWEEASRALSPRVKLRLRGRLMG